MMMTMRRLLVALPLALVSAIAAVSAQQQQQQQQQPPPPPSPATAYAWNLPAGFSAPRVPADKPMSVAKVELGRHLFYDVRLSGNGTQSCASCHKQELAFTDGKAHGIGSTGEQNPRSSMSLVNIAYAPTLTWADARLTRLEEQARVPMFGDHPIELGLTPDGPWLAAIKADPTYRRLFASAFLIGPDDITVDHVTKALASFERSIVSARSPFDRYRESHDNSLVSDAVRRGETLFHSQQLLCFTCHAGVNFTASFDFEGRQARGGDVFFNTGLYNIAGPLSYPSEDPGLYKVTQNPRDVGRFKPPSLRNVAVTAPYMHDGSVATLEDAIDHYAAGGRTLRDGPYAGVGSANPNKVPFLRGFTVTADQKADLVAFLTSLTDDELLHDSRFANPWPLRSLLTRRPASRRR